MAQSLAAKKQELKQSVEDDVTKIMQENDEERGKF